MPDTIPIFRSGRTLSHYHHLSPAWPGLRSQCPLMGLASPECPDLGLIAQPRPESQLSESEYHRGLSQM